MKTRHMLLAAALSATTAMPALAQDWTGGYVGAHLGAIADPDENARILFDNDLDGGYGDTVRTGAGADAFSPGFCDGAAKDRTPASGCSKDFGGANYGIRGGYDWQIGDNWVLGVLGEYSMNDARDAVTAFSTTPAYYTMYRKVDGMLALRGRAGYAFGGDGENLIYVTGGVAQAKIDNDFVTSNRANAFSDNGGDTVTGYQAGVGYERRFGDHFTVGLEYLLTSLKDDGYRVHVGQGTAPATNPFLLVNPNGTDFKRSDEDFDLDSLRLTVAYRF